MGFHTILQGIEVWMSCLYLRIPNKGAVPGSLACYALRLQVQRSFQRLPAYPEDKVSPPPIISGSNVILFKNSIMAKQRKRVTFPGPWPVCIRLRNRCLTKQIDALVVQEFIEEILGYGSTRTTIWSSWHAGSIRKKSPG